MYNDIPYTSREDLSTNTPESLIIAQMQKQSVLFKLPPELRLVIYELVLGDLTLDFGISSVPEPELTRVCHTVRNESFPIYAERMEAILSEKVAAEDEA